ncbi:hypothetical protein K400107F7_28190 [Agathobaculum massiliense]
MFDLHELRALALYSSLIHQTAIDLHHCVTMFSSQLSVPSQPFVHTVPLRSSFPDMQYFCTV